jgi:hypothetical protein
MLQTLEGGVTQEADVAGELNAHADGVPRPAAVAPPGTVADAAGLIANLF